MKTNSFTESRKLTEKTNILCKQRARREDDEERKRI